MRRITRITRIATAAALTASTALAAAPAGAHPHVASNASHTQLLADGQNHPGFQPVSVDGLRLSCAGVLEPADAGPAGYGLETAHHGPDAGDPGKADGCYAVVGNPVDNNPAID
ncbi:MAG: hypothetical protein ACRDJP_01635 [Actinomycetota bacterium]